MSQNVEDRLLQYAGFNQDGSPTQVVQNEGRCLHLLNRPGGLKVVQQNIRSMRRNFKKFKEKVIDKVDLDVIIFSECYIYEGYVPVPLEGYVAKASRLNLSIRNDGIVIYAKKSLKPKYKEYNVTGCNNLSVSVDNIIILAIYRAPSKDVKAFNKSLDGLMHRLKNQKNIFVTGDINLDLMTSQKIKDYVDVMDNHGLISSLKEPTRKDPGSNRLSCLDHMMVKTTLKFQPMIHKFDITDHSAVICVIYPHDKPEKARFNSVRYEDVLVDDSLNERKKRDEKNLIRCCNTLDELSDALQKIFKANFKPVKCNYEKPLKQCSLISWMVDRLNIDQEDLNNNVTSFHLNPVHENDILKFIAYIDDVETRIQYSSNETKLSAITDVVNFSIAEKSVQNPSGGVSKSDLNKIICSVTLNNLLRHIVFNNIVSENQYVFKNKKQMNFLPEFIECVTTQLDESKKCLVVFIDFNNTSLNIHSLRDKYFNNMKQYGIDETYFDFFKKLVFRQNVTISKLDPLSFILFLLYIDSLYRNIQCEKIIAFGAEIMIIFTGDNWIDTFRKAETELNKTNRWLLKNFNHFKTSDIKYMPIGFTQTGLPLSTNRLKIQKNRSITCVKKITFGGITLTYNIKWNLELSNVFKKLKHAQYLIGKIQNFLNETELKFITQKVTLPILEDAIIGWGNVNKTSMKKLIGETENFFYLKEDIYKICIERFFAYLYSKHGENIENVVIPNARTVAAKKSIAYTSVYLFKQLPRDLQVKYDKSNDGVLAEWIEDFGVTLLQNHFQNS